MDSRTKDAIRLTAVVLSEIQTTVNKMVKDLEAIKKDFKKMKRASVRKYSVKQNV